MEPVRSNRPSPWNRGGRESVFPRFAGLAVDGIQKKDEAPRACLSPQRLWANGRGSNFASCTSCIIRCSRYCVFRPRIRRTRRVYLQAFQTSSRRGGVIVEKSSMRYAARESQRGENANGIFVKTDGFQVSRANTANTTSFQSTSQLLEIN